MGAANKRFVFSRFSLSNELNKKLFLENSCELRLYSEPNWNQGTIQDRESNCYL